MPKSILITGCSSGIGLDAARTLKARGWQVFASARTAADCARLAGEDLVGLHIDYEDPATFEPALAALLDQTGGTLDAAVSQRRLCHRGSARGYSGRCDARDLSVKPDRLARADQSRDSRDARAGAWADRDEFLGPRSCRDEMARRLCGDEVCARGAVGCAAHGDGRDGHQGRADRAGPDRDGFPQERRSCNSRNGSTGDSSARADQYAARCSTSSTRAAQQSAMACSRR